jgi:hypothetical protein
VAGALLTGSGAVSRAATLGAATVDSLVVDVPTSPPPPQAVRKILKRKGKNSVRPVILKVIAMCASLMLDE